MLSRDAIIACFILSFCCFFASGTRLLVGLAAMISGIGGAVFLASALLSYFPLTAWLNKK